MSKETLSALTRGIHHAAASTSAMLAQQYVQMLAQYFDQQKDGKLYAKMAYVQLGDQHTIAVPLISLVAPRGLALERMKVALSVRIDETELKQATADGDNYHDGDRVSMKISVSPRTRDGERRPPDVTDIDLEFQAGDPPEAMMRLIDSFAMLVDPKKFDDPAALLKRYPPTPLTYGSRKKKEGSGASAAAATSTPAAGAAPGGAASGGTAPGGTSTT